MTDTESKSFSSYWERDRKSMAHRRDHWASAMADVLRVTQPTFRDPQHRSVTQWAELPLDVTGGQFERALNHPVAVWNGGFCAAASIADQITRWLASGSEAV